MNKGEDREKLVAALDWYRMAGVDTLVGDEPTNWFDVSKKAVEPVTPPATRSPVHGLPPLSPNAQTEFGNRPGNRPAPKQVYADHNLATSSPAEALIDARDLSQKAQSIDALKDALGAFDGCSLKRMAKNLCFGDGNPESSLMFVGEAPGRDEDLAGVPFVGRAGQLLNKMLESIDLQREQDVWITNTVYWRPPGNRTPTPQETEICRPVLERQIELIKPKVIVALGGAAAKHLLETTSGIMRLRGKWHEISVAGDTYQLMPTLHPAYLLRTPAAKRLAWRDLLTIKERLDESN